MLGFQGTWRQPAFGTQDDLPKTLPSGACVVAGMDRHPSKSWRGRIGSSSWQQNSQPNLLKLEGKGHSTGLSYIQWQEAFFPEYSPKKWHVAFSTIRRKLRRLSTEDRAQFGWEEQQQKDPELLGTKFEFCLKFLGPVFGARQSWR